MPQIYANAAGGTVTDSPLGTTATTINSANFANLPTIAAPNYMFITLDPTGEAGLPEIVKVTAHTAAATAVTVVRYAQVQAGLTAASGRTHVAGTVWGAAATKASFDDLVAADTALVIPAGTIRQTIATVADPGWLLFNQTVVGAQTLYPALWAVAPAGWKSGANLVLPDLADKVLGGAGTLAAGATGGANTKTIGAANLPVHTHTGPSHTHDVNPAPVAATITDPGHTHPPLAGTGFNMFAGTGASTGTTSAVMLSQPTTGSATTGISATVDIPNTTSTAAGTGATGDGGFANTALDITTARLAVVHQIKAH